MSQMHKNEISSFPKGKILLALLGISFLLLIPVGVNAQQTSSGKYTFTHTGYTIVFPDGWQILVADPTADNISLIPPGSTEDNFPYSMGFSIYPEPGYTLDSYTNTMIGGLQNVAGCTSPSMTHMTVQNLDAIKVSTNCSGSSASGYANNQEEIFIKVNDNYIIAVYGANDHQTFANNVGQFEQVVSTFDFSGGNAVTTSPSNNQPYPGTSQSTNPTSLQSSNYNINGKYVSADYNFQIVFPDGWSGNGASDGLDGWNVVLLKGNDPTSMMSENISFQVIDPSKNEQNSQYNNYQPDPSTPECQISKSTTVINGNNFDVLKDECPQDGDSHVIHEAYVLNHNGYEYSYYALVSKQSQQDDLANFEKSAQTIVIGNTSESPSNTGTISSDQSAQVTATTPEFPTVSSLILVLSMLTIIGFTMISRKNIFFRIK